MLSNRKWVTWGIEPITFHYIAPFPNSCDCNLRYCNSNTGATLISSRLTANQESTSSALWVERNPTWVHPLRKRPLSPGQDRTSAWMPSLVTWSHQEMLSCSNRGQPSLAGGEWWATHTITHSIALSHEVTKWPFSPESFEWQVSDWGTGGEV